MDANEEIALLLVCDIGLFPHTVIDVGGTGHDDARFLQFPFQYFFQFQCKLKGDLRFGGVFTFGSLVGSAVTGIDDDGIDPCAAAGRLTNHDQG